MNAFAQSNSPYLQLFADSAVDWHEWDEALLQKARAEDKLLHISFGRLLSTRTRNERFFYAQEHVGETLNELFVNVKIDVDERPDLVRLFTATFDVGVLIRRADSVMFETYPRSVYINAKRRIVSPPFVYFAWDPYGDGSPRLVPTPTVLNAHATHGSFDVDKGSPLLTFLKRRGMLVVPPKPTPSFEELRDYALEVRKEAIEADEAGTMETLPFLELFVPGMLRLWYLSQDRSRDDVKGLDIALVGMTRWARGESFDHVEGGFFAPLNYGKNASADMQKSLEFNVWALDLLMRGVAVSRDVLLTQAVRETIAFLTDRLAAADGGFCTGVRDAQNSTRLAWDRRTLRRALTEDEYLVIETLYGFDKKANWHGRWLPRRMGSWRSVLDQLFFSKTEAESLLASGRAKLRKLARERDVELLTDTRRPTAGNCAAASALLFAGSVLGEDPWCELGVQTVKWVYAERFVDGALASPTGDQAGLTAMDYALLLKATLDSLEHRWDPELARELVALVTAFKNRHWDGEILSHNAVDLDGVLLAIPQRRHLGRLHAIDALRRALQLYGTLYQDAEAFRMLKVSFDAIESQGVAGNLSYNPSLDFALDFRRGEVVAVLRGPAEACATWRAALVKTYKIFRHVFVIPYGVSRDLPAYLPRMMNVDDRERVTAYLFHDQRALDPIHDLDAALEAFESL